jgi:ferric-dicitrate binding protein FerR (iron transport regulator)
MRNVTTSPSDRLGELMQLAARPHTLQQHLEGRVRLVGSVERMRGSRGRRVERYIARPLAVAALGVAVAAVAIVVVFVRRPPAKPVGWHVENATVEAQGYFSVPTAISIASPASSSARLVFDDGSDVSLGLGSRGRVAGTSPTGAEVVLEQGSAQVRVQHRDRASWTIDAGPYAVHVTGTEFLVSWAAEVETLDVWMRSGRVVVTGPALGDELTLSAGKHLTAKLRDRSSRIDGSPEPAGALLRAPEAAVERYIARPLEEGAPATLDEVSPSANATLAAHEPLAASPSSVRSASPVTSWPARVAKGDYAFVVHEAESQGIGRVISTRPLADLLALGDAARYAGRSSVAERAYTTLRERFPSSPEAHTAAFLLGRVEEEQEQAVDGAMHWYDTYFMEAPAGAFAGDALGRKMILVSRSQGRGAARSIAQRYLERFPGGTYSAAARDLAP